VLEEGAAPWTNTWPARASGTFFAAFPVRFTNVGPAFFFIAAAVVHRTVGIDRTIVGGVVVVSRSRSSRWSVVVGVGVVVVVVVRRRVVAANEIWRNERYQ
jgi:hypothetical protein